MRINYYRRGYGWYLVKMAEETVAMEVILLGLLHLMMKRILRRKTRSSILKCKANMRKLFVKKKLLRR